MFGGQYDVGAAAGCDSNLATNKHEIPPPIITVVIAVFAIWYVAAALMNAPLQRDAYANAGRTDYSTQRLIVASLNMERPKLPGPHQVAGEMYKLIFATPPTSKRSLVYHGLITLEETLIGFVIGAALGIGLAVVIVSVRWLDRSLTPWLVASQTVPIIALAPMIVVILNQFDITRDRAEGGDRRLSVVLSDDGRHGEGLPLARTAATRPHAHLFGVAGADVREAARARQRAVLLRQHEDRRGGCAGRRNRGRSHQERGRRPRRPPACGLLLWPDGADLGRTVRRGGAVGGAGRRHRPFRPPGRAADMDSFDDRPPTRRSSAAVSVRPRGAGALGARLSGAANIPTIILPTPSAIVFRFFTSIPTLAADFWQTMKGMLAGYVIGSGSGLIVAILVDRSLFLQRGLLPLGNLVSALPIVGVAPIMVMWFGFDWPSKAAVVVVMTFFPMLVNAVAGLESASAMERT